MEGVGRVSDGIGLCRDQRKKKKEVMTSLLLSRISKTIDTLDFYVRNKYFDE